MWAWQVEVLTQELWNTESSKEMQVKGLEAQVHDLSQRLQTYEKIEQELDDIVMQSAQSKMRKKEGLFKERRVKSFYFLQWRTPVKLRKFSSRTVSAPLYPLSPGGDYSRGR